MRIIEMSKHTGWGNAISWFDYKKRILVGHMTPKPTIGDKVICEMDMGFPIKTKHFKIYTIVKIEGLTDPPDQFFADVMDSGYIIKNGDKEIKFELKEKCPFCRKTFKKDFDHMTKHMQEKHYFELEENFK